MTNILLLLLAVPLMGADYAAPAGIRPALRRPGAASILPGGRIIAPLGRQHVTGPGPFGLASSPDGRTVVTVNGGPDRYSLTVIETAKSGPPTVHHLVAPLPRKDDAGHGEEEWRGVSMGLAFAGGHAVWVSEGNSGRVRLVDLASGSRKRTFDLNQEDWKDSYTGDLALDARRGLLYVLDQANFRLAVIDTRKGRIVSSLRLGRLPFAIALSPDGRKAWITHLGMFAYQPLAGAGAATPLVTGLDFPAFGFPSAEARDGARRLTSQGEIQVPGLGDPNARESNSVAVVNLADPAAPKLEAFVRTGLPFGEKSEGGSSPSGVVATADRVFVSNAHNDSITVIDARTNAVETEIPIRIPGLENLRGVLPIGMAVHPATGWLLVAEAGINAVGVIDTRARKVIGHLPAAWFPTRVAVEGDTLYVANARGQGTGPNAGRGAYQDETFLGTIQRGTVSIFPLPAAAELAGHTLVVMEVNGFHPRPEPPPALPAEIRYVVLIVKGDRSFDEVLGDLQRASNGPVMGFPPLARFGASGYVTGDRERLSIKDINVTPNHHALAARWAFSDNFYADSGLGAVGSYPDAWSESSRMAASGGQKDFRFPTTAPGRLSFGGNASVLPEQQPEAGTLWHHLERNKISFRNYGEGLEGALHLTNRPMPDPLYRNTCREYPPLDLNIPDQHRADVLIRDLRTRYIEPGKDLPRFLFIHLPNDRMARPRPRDGYAFQASYVADNDYALGRIIEFFSGTKWWRQMAVFVTEADAEGGRDHLDAHRTLLLSLGPYARRNYASHVNAGFPGLLKTVFRLLGLPPLNLFDAAASDLADCFTTQPDFAPYKALPEDSRIFNPAGL